MARAQIISAAEIDTDKVVFGATVKLFDAESESDVIYRIVGEDEADIKQGLISINSPVAKALIGHRADDEVHIKVPSGTRIYEIIDIQYL
jgi:transcription elongation factor GreA